MDRRIEQSLATLEARLHTRIAIADLARAAGLSVSQFGRLFRAETGMTPSAHLRHLRMTRARILLERTSLSVAEIMRQIGVTDASHFTRDFRRAHGLSPRALRLQLRAAGEPARYMAQWDPGG